MAEAPKSEISVESRRDRAFGPHTDPPRYPDADVIAITPAFDAYILKNAAIERLWTG